MKKILITFSQIFYFLFYAQNNIPIIGFMGVSDKNASVINYKKMYAAGINISLMDFRDFNAAKKALNNANLANVKLILMFPSALTNKSEIEQIKNHNALYGYYIADEPSLSEFSFFENRILQIKRYDDTHLFYINLHPNHAPAKHLGTSNYAEYLEEFASKSTVQFFSFDNYPVLGLKIRYEWYDNLELIRNISLKFKKPFWGFACTTIHDEYIKPTVAAIRLQQFSNLLYGAQGLQYFRYWGHTQQEMLKSKNIGYSIVDDQGNPTPTYNIVKKVNLQIQRLAWVFFGAKADKVYHTGTEIPEGTSKLMSVPKGFKYFSTYGKNALVSLMFNKKNRFVIIQNKSLDHNITLEYQLAEPMKIVDNSSGKTKNISSVKKLKASVLPGDILIFTSTK